MTLIHLQARSVRFYYDRFLIEADGNVRVSTSNGMTMRGDAFSMDLRLNRFLLAGHVHIEDRAGAQDGAAIADFLDYDRIYFLPITTEPDRWTFIGGDFAHPAKGLQMPGDPFEFPQALPEKPFISSTGATIGSNSFVRFGRNEFDIGSGIGAFIPLPTYYTTFSPNRYLAENSLAGANFDATWQVAGSANTISAVHFRYDTVNKTYLSFEQHFVGQKAYAVFSLNPATRKQKFWNLVVGDHPSNRLEFRSITQLATAQSGLSKPDASGQFTTPQIIYAMPQSFVELTGQEVNSSLLPPGNYHGVSPVFFHPLQLQLTMQSFDHRIGRTPFYEHVGYDVQDVEDHQHIDPKTGMAQPLMTVQGVKYWNISQRGIDGLLYLPGFKLGNSYVETKNYYLNASFEKNRQWFSTPHYLDTATANLSVSKVFDFHFTGFLSDTIENIGDYWGPLQSLEYRSFVPVVNHVKYPGYAAFRGIATFRQLALGLTYANRGDVSATLLLRKHDDFPQPIPDFFTAPQLNNIGQPINTSFYIGEPPYDLTLDTRFRINPHMSIDLSRSYYFHYGQRGWSPQFVFQVLQ